MIQKHELDWFRHYRSLFTISNVSSGPVALTCSARQGSVIGPKEFFVYTKDIVETIDKFAVNHHLYADDSQLFTRMRLEAIVEYRRRFELCVEHIRNWYSSRWLQLNHDKTELKWFGSRCNRTKVRKLGMSLNLCSVVVEPADSVRDHGVTLVSELSMAQHIGKLSSKGFFHLRRLRKFTSARARQCSAAYLCVYNVASGLLQRRACWSFS